MSTDTTCVGEDDSVLDAAKQLDSLGVGALPICGNDERLKGMLTDRDIVVKVLAAGKDPASTKAGELGQGDGKVDRRRRRLDRGGAQDDVRAPGPPAARHRRPRLVGIISQADIARNYHEEKVGDLVEAISQ